MKLIIAKFELYPTDNPEGFAVGYRVHTNNNKSFYKDTVLPLERIEGKTEEEILQLAWSEVGVEILSKVEELESTPPLLGTTWYPPGYEPKEPEVNPDDGENPEYPETPEEPIDSPEEPIDPEGLEFPEEPVDLEEEESIDPEDTEEPIPEEEGDL